MATITPTLSMIGQTYAFRSKNSNDEVVYEGVITGFCNSDEAAKYGNIVSYNNAARNTDATIPSDVSKLSIFFTFRLSNTTGTQTDYVFAPEWIVDGSFTLVDQSVTVTITVLDGQAATHTTILDVLRAAGYQNCAIASIA